MILRMIVYAVVDDSLSRHVLGDSIDVSSAAKTGSSSSRRYAATTRSSQALCRSRSGARGGRAEQRLGFPLTGHYRLDEVGDFAALVFILLAITVIATISLLFLAGGLTST
jgi:hypothetical protein